MSGSTPDPEKGRLAAEPGSNRAPGDPSTAQTSNANSSRLAPVVDWLRRRADTSLGRLTMIWFRRYFEASRNSGAAASAYITVSVLPTALVIIAMFNLAKGDENAFAARLNAHMKLNGDTANLVTQLFGTTSNNLLAASVTIVISFVVWACPSGSSTGTCTHGPGASM